MSTQPSVPTTAAITAALSVTTANIVTAGSTIVDTIEADAGNAILRVLTGVSSIVLGVPDAEIKIFEDCWAAARADIAAGKTWGVAAADAWTTFYNEEFSEGKSVLAALLSFLLQSEAP